MVQKKIYDTFHLDKNYCFRAMETHNFSFQAKKVAGIADVEIITWWLKCQIINLM